MIRRWARPWKDTHGQQNGQQRATGVVEIEGPLDCEHVRPMYERLLAAVRDPDCSTIRVDLKRLEGLDSAGLALLSYVRKTAESSGKGFELEHVPPACASRFELVPRVSVVPVQPRGPGRTHSVAAAAIAVGESLLGFAVMSVDAVRQVIATALRPSPIRFGAVVEQCVRVGVNAVPIVSLLGALVGIVLAFQSVHQLGRFGADLFVAEVVALGMVREFGPLITAIIIAGRTGASIAAELGTMSVHEELDALRVFGIDPISYLVAPRLMAITLAGPTLTLLSMVAGIAAGVGVSGLLELPTKIVLSHMIEALVIGDFVLGFVKSLLFAWVVGLLGCFLGLETRGGPTSVGRNTTRAVVVSIFAIVVIDSAVTVLWTLGRDV